MPAAPTCWAVWTREYASGPSSSCIKCSHKSSQWPQKVVGCHRFSVAPDPTPHRPGVRRRKILVGRWAGAIGRGRVDRAPPWARWTCDRLRSRCAPAWRLRLSGWAMRAPRRWSKTSRPPWACAVGRVGFGFFVMRQLPLPERLNRAQRRGSDRPTRMVDASWNAWTIFGMRCAS